MTASIVPGGKASNVGFGVGSVSATIPAATPGNLLVAFGGTNGFTGVYTLNTPSGWISKLDNPSANSDKRIGLFLKKAVGGETGVTISQAGPADATMDCHIFEIQGVDADAIIANTVNILATGSEDTDGASTTLASTAIDPASTLAVLFLFGIYRFTGTISSWSNGFVTETDTGFGSHVGSKTVTNPGSTTTTATFGSGGASIGIVLALPTIPVVLGADFSFFDDDDDEV